MGVKNILGADERPELLEKKKKAFSNVAGSVWTVLDISPS